MITGKGPRRGEGVTRASGCLFGLAYGDALGKPTEFRTVAEIRDRYGSGGPRDLEGDPALVTDDTQMTLAVGWALVDASSLDPEEAEPALRCEVSGVGGQSGQQPGAGNDLPARLR